MTYKIFVINLKHRTDRKEHVLNEFKKVGLDITEHIQFFDAIYGKELNLNLEIVNLFNGNDFGNRKGVIGCALSHYELWLNLLKEKETDYYVIFEDDIQLNNNFINGWNFIKTYINPNEHDVLYMGYHKAVGYDYYNIDQNNQYDANFIFQHINRQIYVGGFFSYIITKNGALKMLKFIENKGIIHGIDYLMNINNNLNIQEIIPNIVISDWVKYQNDSVDSDIQKDNIGFNFDNIIDYNGYKIVKNINFEMTDDIVSKKDNIQELIKFCNKNDNIHMFNNYGFFKNSENKNNLKEEQNSILFIKYDNIINVKIMCNWCSSIDLIDEWNPMSKGSNKWNNVRLTDSDNADYFVIINMPQNGAYYNPDKTIIFQMEPFCNNDNQNWGIKTWGSWEYPDESKFLKVRTHKNFYNNCSWQLRTIYHQFMNKDFNQIYKKIFNDHKNINNTLSTICSSKYFDPGHIKRIDFLKYLEEKNDILLHIFGTDNHHQFKNYKGQLGKNDKDAGLVSYKYYFMAENNFEKNYITEKFWEPIISECLLFYFGCPNVNDYIDPNAYVQLDLNDFEKSYMIIKDAIENDLYSQRLPYIQKEKYKILNYYNFYPTIERIITLDLFKETIPNLCNSIKIYIKCLDINNISYKCFPLSNTLSNFGFNVQFICEKNLLNIYENILNDDNNSYMHYMILSEHSILTESYKKLLYHMLLLPHDFDLIQLGNSVTDYPLKIQHNYNSFYYNVRKYIFKNNVHHMISKKGIEKILDFNNKHEFYYGLEEDLFYECYENIDGFIFYVSNNLFDIFL